jgi:diguanylate cyclase (GGDEF)-like protein
LFRVIRGVEDTAVSLTAISNWSKAVPKLEEFLLHIARSPYGLGRKFDSLAQATVTSGARPIQAQCTFFLFREFTKQLDCHPISKEMLWSQALYRGALAYKIAQTAGYNDPREALIVGLIQDVGVQVIAALFPDDRRRLEAALSMPRALRLQEEQRIANMTHAHLLKYIAQYWKLNQWFIDAVGDHHTPQPATTDRRTRRLIQICSTADAIADIFQSRGHPECINVAKRLMASLDSRDKLDLEALCKGARDEAPRIATSFGIEASVEFNMDHVALAESEQPKVANAEYQHLADELYAVSRERDDLKKLLERAYYELKELRAADSITDVTNRDYFLRSLEEAVKSLCRQEAPFSLVLVNLDDFTTVNTTYGYEVGDEILRQYARRVATILRPSDLIGRIGNDTLAVLLRAAAADGGTIAARRCLAAISSRPFYTPEQTAIEMTASFGGATAMPMRESITSKRLLANAENALRDAKTTRNTVKWWHGI